jgi:hypothetical protein
MLTHAMLRHIFLAVTIASVFTGLEVSRITTQMQAERVASHDDTSLAPNA